MKFHWNAGRSRGENTGGRDGRAVSGGVGHATRRLRSQSRPSNVAGRRPVSSPGVISGPSPRFKSATADLICRYNRDGRVR